MAAETPALPYDAFLITETADQATFVHTDPLTGESHTMDLAALRCSCCVALMSPRWREKPGVSITCGPWPYATPPHCLPRTPCPLSKRPTCGPRHAPREDERKEPRHDHQPHTANPADTQLQSHARPPGPGRRHRSHGRSPEPPGHSGQPRPLCSLRGRRHPAHNPGAVPGGPLSREGGRLWSPLGQEHGGA